MRSRWIKIALGTFFAIEAHAITWEDFAHETRPDQFLKRVRASLQHETGFGLRAELPLGAYGVQADSLLQTLAPHLVDGCKLALESAKQVDATIHERYQLVCHGTEVAYSGVALHLHKARLSFLRAELPDAPSLELAADSWSQDILQQLDYDTDSCKRVLADQGSNALVPAFLCESRRRYDELPVELLVDAENGQILSELPRAFAVSNVYVQNPSHGAIQSVTLPDLRKTGYLDGKNFLVYAPTASDRLHSPDQSFAVDPKESSVWEFDQVQAYYGATKAQAWFRSNFAFDHGEEPLVISVHDAPRGRADNAEYRFDQGKPKILIGIGTEQVNGLARDNDVVTHEYAHHVIFQSLRSTYGESGALHEGTADYFTYAMYDNPYLAESVMPGAPYIRTALLDETARIDDPNLTPYTHYRGQIWSATLWQLRQTVGRDFDKVVYKALAYLNWNSGYADVIVALLNADRDLNPLAATDPYYDTYGANYCKIFDAIIARGYATYAETLDPGSCPLKLTDAAAESRAYAASLQPKEKDGKEVGIELFGRKCSVVAGTQATTSSLALLWSLLLLPLLLTFARAQTNNALPARRRGRHAV